MKCQVIFLNSSYRPPEEEAERLEAVQEALTLFHAEYAFVHRNAHPVTRMVRKREAHQDIRKRLSVVKD